MAFPSVQCTATTKFGERCKKHAMKDSTLCQVHNPNGSYQQYLNNRQLALNKAGQAPITYHAKMQ